MTPTLAHFVDQQPDPGLVGNSAYSCILEMLADVEEGGADKAAADVLDTAVEALDALEAWTNDIRTRLEKYIRTEGSAD